MPISIFLNNFGLIFLHILQNYLKLICVFLSFLTKMNQMFIHLENHINFFLNFFILLRGKTKLESYSANSDCGKNVIQKGNEIFKNQSYSRESLKQFHPAEILWLADRKGFDENSPTPNFFPLVGLFLPYFLLFLFSLFSSSGSI